MNKLPEKGRFLLVGCEYDGLSEEAGAAVTQLLHYLELQPDKPFSPQPWQQLAKVFRNMGHEFDATKVLIAKEIRRRKCADRSTHGMAWSWFLEKSIGFGYRPGKALEWILLVLVVGFFVFKISNDTNLMTAVDPVSTKLHAEFSPIWYTLDRFFPIIDLGQDSVWIPRPDATLLWWFQYLYIAAGWVLSTLLVAALTGLIRRE